jgi:hypothetical protein
MLEMIWRLRLPTLDDESVMLPLILAMADTPGFSPDRYDLNKKEQWRNFDAERLVVDALTQRTQLVRIQGQQEGAIAMLALGKRDEQPTAILRVPEDTPVQDLVAEWTGLYEELPLESTLVSAGGWRESMQTAGLGADAASELLGMVFGWRRDSAPAGISQIDDANTADTPIHLAREANHLVLWLADRPEVDDQTHRKALEYVSRRLRRAQ